MILVSIEACSRWNQATNDDVFLKATEPIRFPFDRSLGQNTGSLLEGCGRDEAVSIQRGFGNPQQDRSILRWSAACDGHRFVNLLNLIHFNEFTRKHRGVTTVIYPDLRGHLTDDHFNVFVGNSDSLGLINPLDFIHQQRLNHLQTGQSSFVGSESLDFCHEQRFKKFVGVGWAIGQPIACYDAIAVNHNRLLTRSDRIFGNQPIIINYFDFDGFIIPVHHLSHTILTRQNSRLLRLTSFKKFFNPRQTLDDVSSFRPFKNQQHEVITPLNKIAIINVQDSTRRHTIRTCRSHFHLIARHRNNLARFDNVIVGHDQIIHFNLAAFSFNRHSIGFTHH